MPRETSLMDAAIKIMSKEKKSFNLYDLYDRVSEQLNLSEEEYQELLNKFYTDLTTSAKFIYVGDNEWNLKANEKVELWEKDGSFYKEYTVIDLPEEYKVDPFATTKKAKPVVVEEVVEAKPVVEELPVIEETVEEPVTEPVIEPVIEPETTEETEEIDFEEEEFEDEEVFDDYDDFDEDKYNEYMDTYEDQYDD